MIVGIDLGTTNSAIGIFENGRPRLLPNSFQNLLTPSVVGMSDKGTVLVGQAAKDRLVTHPAETQSVFKRYMGTNRNLPLGRQSMRAEELSSFILRSLKQDAETALGTQVSKAVISVPAYFSNVQREATKLAGQLAGLEVIRLINEPTAAAMAYSLHEGEDARQFLVCDLGGGTFDVSILDYYEGVMEVKASTGDTFLGGEDFTQVIYEAMLHKASKVTGKSLEFLDKEYRPSLFPKAERLKIELTSNSEANWNFAVDGKDVNFALSINEYESLCSGLIERLRSPLERALRDTKISARELTSVILVGGATRMRMIHKMVSRLFGLLPHCTINPDEVVALGAAVQAGLSGKDKALADKVLTDVSPHTLGVETAVKARGSNYMQGVFLPIIERNTPIPCSYSKILSPIDEKQTSIELKVFEGESRFVEDNVLLGRLDIPIKKIPATEEQVDIRFTYDVSGLLEVEAKRMSDNCLLRTIIEKTPNTLKAEQIEAIFAKHEKLKLHPKDDVQNVSVVNKGRRMYEEVKGDLREEIGSCLDRFMAILNSQDRARIDRARDVFAEELKQLERHFRVFDP